ncbi:MAG: hypothetical protein AAF433_08975 [Bacteroidota bacterium]
MRWMKDVFLFIALSTSISLLQGQLTTSHVFFNEPALGTKGTEIYPLNDTYLILADGQFLHTVDQASLTQTAIVDLQPYLSQFRGPALVPQADHFYLGSLSPFAAWSKWIMRAMCWPVMMRKLNPLIAAVVAVFGQPMTRLS